ncbi:MAG: SixA phosphatase family protein [Deltaproteobacteria bacterium]
MKLILIRHADAEPDTGGPLGDPGRALTSLGRQQARDTALDLQAQLQVAVPQFWTSPLVRAVQTTEILASAWPAATVAIADSLATGRPIPGLLELVRELPDIAAALLVGHEPMLGDLSAALLQLPALPIAFEKGAALWLCPAGSGWRFERYRAPMRPALARLPGSPAS